MYVVASSHFSPTALEISQTLRNFSSSQVLPVISHSCSIAASNWPRM